MANKTMLIIVCGGTGSGKTTIANEIKKILPKHITSQIISMDEFYKSQEHQDKNLYLKNNFDHPNAFDWELIYDFLNKLLNKTLAEMPIYNFAKSERTTQTKTINPTDVIIFEGILSLYSSKINALAEIKIFVDTPDDERFIRRLIRDKTERGRNDENIIGQWRNTVRKMHHLFVQPLKAEADIVIPWYKMNETAIRAIKGAIEALYNNLESSKHFD
ncbi:MAG: uridine kinase [Mycoplasmataceae bacterium]|nr:uridine kinase [Mycoplasmataceae bacterium]